jgi:hypothetical protein
MATRVWVGSVRPVAQVTQWLFGGTWESTDIVNATIGSKTVSVVAGSTTITTVIDNVVTGLELASEAEFSSITWTRSGNYLVGTADEAGVPFACTVSTTETGGGGADAQTIDGSTSSSGTATTSCTGPNFANVAGNWSGSTLPVDGDTVIFADSDVDCLYGLDNNGVTPAEIYFDSSYTGKIGLPVYNDADYYEYRDRFLKYGNSGDAGNISITVGQGEGSGSPRIKFDAGTGRITLTVLGTGIASTENERAFEFLGTNASNEVNVSSGSVGIALHAGSVATVATLRVGYQTNVDGDSDVLCGLGATLTTVTQSGGVVETRTNLTTLTVDGGEHIKSSGSVTTANINGGTLIYNTTGTLTTLVAAPTGILDFSRDLRTKTVTNLTVNSGSTLKDPHGVVTYTNGILFSRCRPGDVTWEAPINKTWTPS